MKIRPKDYTSLKPGDPVGKIPLIGASQAQRLKKLEITTVEDLLHHYPFRYDDFSRVKKISEVVFGETATIAGAIREIQNVRTRGGKSLIRAKLEDATGLMGVVWFNQPYLTQILKPRTAVNLSGKVGEFSGKLCLVSPEYELAANPSPQGEALPRARPPLKETIHTGRLVPVFPETAGLSSKWLRSRINFVLKENPPINDFLPPTVKKEENLLDLNQALQKIHFPQNQGDIDAAKKRLGFDEVLKLQLSALTIKKAWQEKRSSFTLSIENCKLKIENFIRTLPFGLTHDQRKAITEILNDLTRDRPMNRLLQGEVGSGKTVVAAVAAFATGLTGYKTIYMAPTEILAIQHHQTFQKLLNPYGVKVTLVTSSTRQNPKFQISNFKFQIAIGTHALLYNLKEMEKVGLVVIDEQHKFGVEQRTGLLSLTSGFKDRAPHLLTMTATPIPRTLALAYLADLDLSVITEMPKNRRKITTWFVPAAKRPNAYEWIKKKLQEEKSQAYIVCPFVEESEKETLKSVKAATKEYESLKEFFKPLRAELIHGRLKAAAKEIIMNQLAEGKIDVLVATPVVEVGLDNPNATIIVIEAAERFGLASLHQLRGRVGRGEKQSYCLLFSGKNSPENSSRLKLLEKCSSGLRLAELDLKNRGGGSFFGKVQSGFHQTKIADLSDTNLLLRAKKWAEFILTNKNLRNTFDPRLTDRAIFHPD